MANSWLIAGQAVRLDLVWSRPWCVRTHISDSNVRKPVTNTIRNKNVWRPFTIISCSSNVRKPVTKTISNSNVWRPFNNITISMYVRKLVTNTISNSTVWRPVTNIARTSNVKKLVTVTVETCFLTLLLIVILVTGLKALLLLIV